MYLIFIYIYMHYIYIYFYITYTIRPFHIMLVCPAQQPRLLYKRRCGGGVPGNTVRSSRDIGYGVRVFKNNYRTYMFSSFRVHILCLYLNRWITCKYLCTILYRSTWGQNSPKFISFLIEMDHSGPGEALWVSGGIRGVPGRYQGWNSIRTMLNLT